MIRFSLVIAAILFVFGTLPQAVLAHGFVGERFFPATIATDDPFAVDELSISASAIKSPGDDGEAVQIAGGFEFVKEIFPRFAVGIEGSYLSQNPGDGKTVTGWDNFGISLKYELWRSEAHEAIVSIGLDADVGGTGTKHAGAESFSTFTPTIYFGKGFGDLPDAVSYLKPLAITGTIGQSFPTSAEESNALETGFAIEYSLPYLQSHVKNIGMPAPLKDMIPLVEFTFETPENRDDKGHTIGTINPGVLWETRYCQLGAEAIIPINHASGDHVGFVVNLQIYIDDIAPAAFGHPLFGGGK